MSSDECHSHSFSTCSPERSVFTKSDPICYFAISSFEFNKKYSNDIDSNSFLLIGARFSA